MKKHMLSVEKLHHFRCGACNKWWCIADAPPARKVWHCPWCGHEASAQKK